MIASPNALPSTRDLRIDFFRGLALVMIFVNHVPGNPLSALTQRNWGLSDSADLFVLLAGISSALAYGRFFDRNAAGAGLMAVFSRIWSLYIMHLMMFLVIAALCVVAAERLNDPTYLETLGIDVFLQAPAGFIVDVLTLRFLPGYLDILPLYIILLAMVPVLVALNRRHWLLPLLLSLGLYAGANLAGLNLPNTRTASAWFFNPFAWQLLFVIGFSIGRALQGQGPLGEIRPRLRHVITALAVLVTLAGIVLSAPWREIDGLENAYLVNPALLGAFSKTNFHPTRLVDLMAKFWLVLVLVPMASAWLRSAFAAPLIWMGQHSLEVFVLGNVLAVAGGILATTYGFQPWLMVAINGIGIGAMLGLAALLEWRKTAMASLASRPRPLPVAAE
ncbi:MAG: OpgC family protein [Rhabdaerophilum sp.]